MDGDEERDPIGSTESRMNERLYVIRNSAELIEKNIAELLTISAEVGDVNTDNVVGDLKRQLSFAREAIRTRDEAVRRWEAEVTIIRGTNNRLNAEVEELRRKVDRRDAAIVLLTQKLEKPEAQPKDPLDAALNSFRETAERIAKGDGFIAKYWRDLLNKIPE
jgi:chromosome segregation ATPase